MENTREIVLDMLLELEKTDNFSHLLIRSVLEKYDYLDSREKAFIKRVCEGTVERKIELDYYLNAYSKVPVHKMKPLIRCLLRMSVYQLVYMDSIPDSAVCNEACKLATKRKFGDLKGFVNGLLRNIAKNKAQLPLPDPQKDYVSYLSVRYSMPEWIIRIWEKEYKREALEPMLAGLLEIQPVTIRFRVDLSATDRERQVADLQKQGFSLTQSKYLPFVYRVENGEKLADSEGFREGFFTIQDVSSALAVCSAGITREDFVMDMCAAPGGKSVLASELGEKVLSGDVSEAKMDRIYENLERMHRTNMLVRVHDATVFDSDYEAKADVVLLDVPCSGLGVMGKKRDVKYHASSEGIQSITQLQRQIVEACWRYVKPGGILLYSTCTIHPAENRKMVKWILQNLPFEAVDLEKELPESLAEDRLVVEGMERKQVDEALSKCYVQMLPGFMESDGFFFAKLRRKE